MKLVKIHPHVLKKEIKYFYLLKNQFSHEIPECQGHLPDGTFELMINYGASVYHSNGTGEFLKRPEVMLIGGYKKFHYVRYTGNIHLIGVVFEPGYLSHVIKDRMDQSKETFASAASVFGKEVNQIAENLLEIEDIGQIRLILENYFLGLIDPNESYQNERVTIAVDMMQKSQGQIRVNEITDHLCMSQRNFRRVFGQTTGYSPREMLRIIRAKRLIHFLKTGQSIRKAARQLGYYDAAHIMHDFKAIGGPTPSTYIDQMNTIDQSFFEQSEYAS